MTAKDPHATTKTVVASGEFRPLKARAHKPEKTMTIGLGREVTSYRARQDKEHIAQSSAREHCAAVGSTYIRQA